MDGPFLPSSFDWVDEGIFHGADGEGDGDGCLPSYVQQGSSLLLPCAGDAAAGSSQQASMVQGPFTTSSSSAVVLTGAAEAKAAAASRMHCLSEKRRRERINGHLSTLRCMVPGANFKMDKASILASVIQEIRVLETKAVDVSRGFTVPSAVNHVSVVECEQSSEEAKQHATPLIRASICCDDRPDLFSEISEALHGLRLKALRADIVSLGGRVQSLFVLARAGGDGTVSLSSLVETLKQVLGRVACMDEEGLPQISSRRGRFFRPQYSDIPL